VPSAKIPKDLKFANYDLFCLMPRSLMHLRNHFKRFPKTHPKTATSADFGKDPISYMAIRVLGFRV
jgi:hypothetical protein